MEEIRTSSTTQTPSGTVRTQEVHQTKKTPSPLVWGLIIVLLILLSILWLFKQEQSATPNETITSVSEGEVVADFPPELLAILETVPPMLALEETHAFEESYSVSYRDNNRRQPVVRYSSSLSLGDNVSVFATFFANNRDWDIVSFADPETTEPTSFYARQENGGEVNITFASTEDGVMVEISYLAPEEPTVATTE